MPGAMWRARAAASPASWLPPWVPAENDARSMSEVLVAIATNWMDGSASFQSASSMPFDVDAAQKAWSAPVLSRVRAANVVSAPAEHEAVSDSGPALQTSAV